MTTERENSAVFMRGNMKIPAIRKLPSGNYFCQLRIDGQSISITDTTEKKVYAKAVAYKAGILLAEKEPLSITLREAMDKYIDARRGRRSESTIEGYEKIRNNHFLDIQGKPLAKLTAAMVDRSVQSECKRPATRRGATLSPKTIKNAVFFLRSVLHEYDVDAADKAIIPEVKRKVAHILPPETLVPIVIGSSIELPCLLAMWLSLSMSEIRGLTKSRSIHGDLLIVEETVVRVKGEDVRKAGGKEEQRSRALTLPPHIKALIDAVDSDIIVPLTPSQIEKRFSALLTANNLPHMTFHQLRHVSASTMATLGIPDKVSQERGGWKTDHVMKAVYTHTFVGERKAADAIINSYFENIITK